MRDLLLKFLCLKMQPYSYPIFISFRWTYPFKAAPLTAELWYQMLWICFWPYCWRPYAYCNDLLATYTSLWHLYCSLPQLKTCDNWVDCTTKPVTIAQLHIQISLFISKWSSLILMSWFDLDNNIWCFHAINRFKHTARLLVLCIALKALILMIRVPV